jgi:hypothetical protein
MFPYSTQSTAPFVLFSSFFFFLPAALFFFSPPSLLTYGYDGTHRGDDWPALRCQRMSDVLSTLAVLFRLHYVRKQVCMCMCVEV